MIVAIWGRDGSGKSMVADGLALLFARQGLTAVIDTDLTQPTLPVRLPAREYAPESSLGSAVSGAGTHEAKAYLHQHPRIETLFYAGLTAADDYLSYEIGLDAFSAAERLLQSCRDCVDHVILDCSGQRTDPFVPVAMTVADIILIALTPDPQGVWWWTAVKPFIDKMGTEARVLPVLSMVQKHHRPDWFSEAAKISPAAVLPYCRELDSLRSDGELPDQASSFGGRTWNRQIAQVYKQLNGHRGDRA